MLAWQELIEIWSRDIVMLLLLLLLWYCCCCYCSCDVAVVELWFMELHGDEGDGIVLLVVVWLLIVSKKEKLQHIKKSENVSLSREGWRTR
jgi:hypothetical protein